MKTLLLKDFEKFYKESDWDFLEDTFLMVGKKTYNGVFIKVYSDGSLWFSDKPNPLGVETKYVKIF